MKTLLFTLGLLISGIHAQAQYCGSFSTNLYSHHQIQYFQFDSLIHVTSSANPQHYNDYSGSHVINTKLGGKHVVLLSKGQNPYSPGVGNTVGFSIWIDFNNDFNFANNEKVLSYYGTAGIYRWTAKDTIFFPANATTGLHRLRVRSEWGRAPDLPCDDLWGGETEDYTINIAAGTTALNVSENAEIASLRFYPNPSASLFALDLKGTYKTIQVKISDISGKIIKEQNFTNTRQLNLEIANPPGIYLATVHFGSYSKVFKLVKQ